ncbi:MAG: hypothetical protein P8049_05690 [Gemmatimonadota bacterium]
MEAAREFERLADWLRAILRDGRVAALFLFLLLSHSVLDAPKADPDMFARVAVGRLVERDGGVSHTDPFAYTPKLDRWVDHEWLSGVVFWQAARTGGDTGLLILAMACMAASLVLVAEAQRKLAPPGAPVRSWLFACLLPLPWLWRSVVRSQVFTYLLLPAFLLAMADYRRREDPRALLPLPFLMLFWANAHGGFVTGLGLLGLFALVALFDGRRFAAPLWLAAAGCAAVTLITPYGLDYWRYLAGALTMERAAITEWGPLIRTPLLAAWVALVAALWTAGLFKSRFRVPPEVVALPAIALIFALRSGRLSAAFLMTVAVYGIGPVSKLPGRTRSLASRLPESWRRAAAVCAVVALVPLSVPVGRLLTDPESRRLSYDAYPVDAIEWLRENRASGTVLVGFAEGSYALWRLYPEFLISMDGRYEEVYPQETVDLVASAVNPNAPDHEAAFERVRPEYILAKTSGARAVDPDGYGAGWRVIYADGKFSVLEPVRTGAPADSARDDRLHGSASAPEAVRYIWDPLF